MPTTKESVAYFVDHQLEAFIGISQVTKITWDDSAISTAKNVMNTPMVRDFILNWFVRLIEGSGGGGTVGVSVAEDQKEVDKIKALGFDYNKILDLINLLARALGTLFGWGVREPGAAAKLPKVADASIKFQAKVQGVAHPAGSAAASAAVPGSIPAASGVGQYAQEKPAQQPIPTVPATHSTPNPHVSNPQPKPETKHK